MPKVSEDWRAVATGGLLLGFSLVAVFWALSKAGEAQGLSSPLKPWLATPGKWSVSPLDAMAGKSIGVLGAAATLLVVFGFAATSAREASWRQFFPAFGGVFALTLLSYLAEKQQDAGYYGLAYPLWAIVLGLAIANTVGVPAWLRPALRTELYMKTGLVLLGAEVLLGKLLALGLPGIAVAWIVTPIVLCTTFWFGQRVLRMESAPLNMVISADMSVCGVSAAIATAAACRAKKEELSLAIGLSMAFTVAMMLAMPPLIHAMGLPPAVGGAWIGGTIDSTGAVAAAGELLSTGDDDTALVTATAVKMIQNILIGVVAFAVAAYWVVRERGEDIVDAAPPASLSGAQALAEIWRRLPKFVFGFLGASLVFSLIQELVPQGGAIVGASIEGSSKTLRDWCFALAFASIGLETNFRALAGPLRSGKPVVLYVCGQSLNLALTLAMAWLMFGVLFPPRTAVPNTPTAKTQETAAARLAEAGINPTALFYTDHPRHWREPADSSAAGR